MSYPELLKKFPKPGVPGSPCRNLGYPPSFILPSTLADGECGKGEKKGFSGDTPAPPAEGLPPSCTSCQRLCPYINAYEDSSVPPAEGLPPSCTSRQLVKTYACEQGRYLDIIVAINSAYITMQSGTPLERGYSRRRY